MRNFSSHITASSYMYCSLLKIWPWWLRWLLKEGGGCIFESGDIFKIRPRHVQFSQARAEILQCLFCHTLAYAVTAYDVCLHLLVPPLAQHCFFMYCGMNRWKEKSTLCNNFIQKKAGWDYFQGWAYFWEIMDAVFVFTQRLCKSDGGIIFESVHTCTVGIKNGN